jgi:hypothetical protein
MEAAITAQALDAHYVPRFKPCPAVANSSRKQSDSVAITPGAGQFRAAFTIIVNYMELVNASVMK